VARRPDPVKELDWSGERARELGEAVVGLWAELVERLPELPVNRDFESGSVKEALQLSVPEEPLGHDELVARLRELAFEQSMYPGHPSFLAYISGSGTVPGAAASMLAAGLNQNVGGWRLGSDAVRVLAVDERRHEVLLFGGSRSRKATNETWVLAGGTWRQLHPALAPSPRVNASMAYDPVTRRLLLVGTYLPNGSGFLGGAMDSWSWDGTTWRQLHPTNDPDPDLYSAAVDAARHQVILHRGGAPLVATWTWDGTNWAQHPGAAGPAGFGGMSYDPLTGMVINVLFNPNGVDSSITWGWTGSTWREVTETQGLFTKGLLMAFDLPSHRLVAVNGPGCDAQGCSTETWLWDGRGWTRTAATHGPHNPGALVTDPASGSALLLGGPNQDDRYSQAWLWTGSDWARI
jgi:hypothetical protein